jgi:predicted Zn-dependent peptidase
MHYTPKHYKQKNGLNVIVIPQKDSPSVTVGALVGVGTNYERASNNGISHFLEHMCFKGTTKRPTPLAISEALENLGASYNAFTDRDMTGYWAKVATPHFEKAFDIIADMYLDPIFPAEELEREKGVIIEETNMYNDMPQAQAFDEADTLLYGDQPAGWHILGTKKNILATSKEDFVKYRTTFYTAPNTILFVAGAVQPATVKRMVQKRFSNLSKRNAPKAKKIAPYTKGKKVSLIKKASDQTHFVLGIPTVSYSHKDVPALVVLKDILGGSMSSRLFQRIREQMGAAYYVRAHNALYASHGYMAIAAGVSNDKFEKSIQATIEELHDIADNLPTNKEFTRAKQHIIGGLMLSLETSDDVGFFFARNMIRTQDINTPRELIRRIKKVTPQQVQQCAKKYLKPENYRLAAVGPHSNTKKITALMK